MIIENSLNPNCSEAVIRINAQKLSSDQKETLYKALEKAVEKYDFETWVYQQVIFGIEMIVVKGDQPYNDSETLERIINKYNSQVEYELTDE